MRGFPIYQRQEEYKGIGVVPTQERPFLSPLQGLDEAGREMVEAGRLMQREQQRAHRAGTMVETTAGIAEIQHDLDMEVQEGKWPESGVLQEEFDKRVQGLIDQVDPETWKLIQPEVIHRQKMMWYDLEKSQFQARGELERARLDESLKTIGVAAMRPQNDPQRVQEYIASGEQGIAAMPVQYFRGGVVEKQKIADAWRDQIWSDWFAGKQETKGSPEEMRQAMGIAQLTPDRRTAISERVTKYGEDFVRDLWFQAFDRNPREALGKVDGLGLDAETAFKLKEYGKQVIQTRENQALFKQRRREEALQAAEEKKLYGWMRAAEVEIDPAKREEQLLRVRTEADLLLDKGSVNQSTGNAIFNHVNSILGEMQRQNQDLNTALERVNAGHLAGDQREVDALYQHEVKGFLDTPGEKNLADFHERFIAKTGKFSTVMKEGIRSAVVMNDAQMLPHYQRLMEDIKRTPAGRLAWSGLDEEMRIFFNAYQENAGKPGAYKLAYEQAFPDLRLGEKKNIDAQWEGKDGWGKQADRNFKSLWANSGKMTALPEMKAEWDRRMINYRYRIKTAADLEFYGKQAMDDMLNMYSETMIGGRYRWMKDAPELYGINSILLNKFLEEDLNQKGLTMRRPVETGPGFRPPLTGEKIKSREHLQDVFLQLKRMEEGYPVYQVMVLREDGMPEYIKDDRGMVAEWPGRETIDKVKEIERKSADKALKDAQESYKNYREVWQNTMEGLNQ